MNRYACNIRCWIMLLSFNLSAVLLAQQAPDQTDWDGLTLGSKDYFLRLPSSGPVIHVDDGNGWFLSDRHLVRMNLRNGRTEASTEVSFHDGQWIRSVAYENATQSFLALIESGNRIEIARLEPKSLQRTETLYAGDDPDPFSIDSFELEIENALLKINNAIVPLDGATHIWTLDYGTAIRWQKGNDNQYTLSERVNNVTDLVAIGNDRIALITHDGDLQLRLPNGIHKVLKGVFPKGKNQPPLSLIHSPQLNRIVVSSFWSNYWLAFDCDSLKRCWHVQDIGLAAKHEGMNLTVWGQYGVGLTRNEDGQYLLTFINLENGKRRDESFDNWPIRLPPDEFPKEPLVITNEHRAMVFDMETKGIWNQGPFRNQLRNSVVDWIDDFTVAVSSRETFVYDLRQTNLADPKYRLDGRYVTSSSKSHRIAAGRLDGTNIHAPDGSLEFRIAQRNGSTHRNASFGPDGKTFQTVTRDGVFRKWDIESKTQTHEFWLHRPKEASDMTTTEAELTSMIQSLVNSILPKGAGQVDLFSQEKQEKPGKQVIRGFTDHNQKMVGVDTPVFSDFMSDVQLDKAGHLLTGIVQSKPPRLLRMNPNQPADYQLEELPLPLPFQSILDSTGTKIAIIDREFHGEEARPMRTGILTVRQGDSVRTVRIPDLHSSTDPVFAAQGSYVILCGTVVKDPSQYDSPEGFLAVFDAADPSRWVMHRMPDYAMTAAVSPNNQWVAIAFPDIVQIRRLASLLPQEQKP